MEGRGQRDEHLRVPRYCCQPVRCRDPFGGEVGLQPAVRQRIGQPDSGNYSDPINDANILATTNSATPLTQYENYLAEQLPGVYQPNAVTSLTEIAKGLTGVTPQDPLTQIYPENWRFNG